jgi:type VI secretion system protein ImpM
LQAVIDPGLGQEQHVSFDDTGWVAEQLDADHHARALASYLVQPDLSLQVAFELFLQTFTGA